MPIPLSKCPTLTEARVLLKSLVSTLFVAVTTLQNVQANDSIDYGYYTCQDELRVTELRIGKDVNTAGRYHYTIEAENDQFYVHGSTLYVFQKNTGIEQLIGPTKISFTKLGEKLSFSYEGSLSSCKLTGKSKD